MRQCLLVVMCAVACTGSGSDKPDPVVPKDANRTGPYGVTLVDDLQLDLGERTDGFPARVATWLVGPERFEGAAPVVIFHHDANLTRADYYSTAARLAARGMLVVLPQWDAAITKRSTQGLIDDTVAAMDWLQSNPLPVEGFEPDVTQFGVAGHGRGGAVALLVAAADPRVVAAAAISPLDVAAQGGAASDWPMLEGGTALDGLTTPLAQVGLGGGEAEPCLPDARDYVAIFDALPDGALQWELPGGTHADVVDPCVNDDGGQFCTACPTSDDPDAIHDFARASLVAFLGKHLMGDDGYAAWLDGDDPFDVVADAVITIKGQDPRTAPAPAE